MSEGEQIARIVPAIKAIRGAGIDAPISVDTTRAAVAAAALDAGADAVNDISGGTDDAAMLPLVASRGVGVMLMHRLTTPERDRFSDRYRAEPDYGGDVVGAVRASLEAMLKAAVAAGIDPRAVVLDPGLGFGKSVDQNLELIARTGDLASLGRPILGAASRKSFTARAAMGEREADPAPPTDRVEGSIACSVVQLLGGARLFRVHDVCAQGRALRAAWRMMGTAAGGTSNGDGG